MPELLKDGTYRPLGYTGKPMNKRQYDEWKEKQERSKPKKIKAKAGTPKFDARMRSKRK